MQERRSDLLNWHGEVGRRMHEDGRSQQLENPDSIFNMDEIGFNTNAKDVKVILRKGSKRNHTIAFGAPHGHITMICCVSASGEAQKPLFLIKGKQRLETTMWINY